MMLKTTYNFNFPKRNRLIFICFLFVFTPLFSQISLNSYAELGTTAVSQGAYGDLSAQLEGRSGSVQTSIGGLLSFSNAKENVLSALLFKASNDFQIKSKSINIEGFYLWKPISTEMRETNFGLLANYKIKHFGFQAGVNSRVYYFTQAAILQYNFDNSTNTTLWEPWNIMYKISYFTQFSEKFDFEAAISNFDRYFIQQETNPMILLYSSYKLNSKLKLYSELAYMQSGLFNLHVNAFGVYLRGGVIWQIN